MSQALLVQLATGIVPLGVAVVAFVQSTKANRSTAESAERAAEHAAELERNKIEADAYNRAKTIYEAGIAQLEKQLDRLHSQLERLETRLTQEQDVSAGLRGEVSELQRQINGLERTVGELRRRLASAGIPADVAPASES